MKLARIIALICAAAAASQLLACADESNKRDETTAQTQVNEDTDGDIESNADMLSERQKVKDNLGEYDFDNQTVNIAVNTFCEEGFICDEMTGDILSDAIYERNKSVEERFNVKLNYVSKDYTETYTDIVNSVSAGDDEFQIVAEHAIYAGQLVTGGLVMNWYDIPNVDFSMPWWSPSNVDDLTYDGVCLLAIGDFALTTIGRTYCMAYDKVAAETYKLPDMYELVYSGGWTLDKLSEFIKNTYSDLNRDNAADVNDYYGFSTSTASKIDTFMWAFDNPIFEKNSAGELEMVINTEKITSIIERLMSFCWDNPDAFYDPEYMKDSNDRHYISEEKFADGTTLFASIMLESGIKYFRDCKNDYGIIPYPKWDENQDDYITMVDGGFSALAIPKTVQDTELVGTVIEALCAETYRSVVPVYYETALKEKGTRDEESKAMVDFVVQKRMFDFGYVFDGWKGYGFILEKMIKDRNPNFASEYASTQSAVADYYDSVLECFAAEAE